MTRAENSTIYGDRTSLLGGHAQTYVQIEQGGKPRALGVRFTRSMLADLPYDPPFDGNNCFDINGDGELTFHLPMPECAGGYQAILFFPAEIVKNAKLPFKWFLLNWNPTGHGPPHVYDVPHFDFHFFIMDYIDRNFIRPGPCGIVVNCDDFEIAIEPVPARYLPPDYQDFQAVEPRMGNHLVDVTSPEFTPAGFTRTFVYGSYNGQITYLEPMVTLAFLESQPDECLPVKQPQAFQVAGYCLQSTVLDIAAGYTQYLLRVLSSGNSPEADRAPIYLGAAITCSLHDTEVSAMNASHLFAGIYWPVILMVLATGWLLLPLVSYRPPERTIHAAAPLPDPVLQGDESVDEDEEEGPASNQAPFSVGSIVGTYASTNIGRGGQFAVSDVGIFKFDGVGTFSGSVTVNPTPDFRARMPASSRRLPEHMR